MVRNHNRNIWVFADLYNSDEILCIPLHQNRFSKSIPRCCQDFHSHSLGDCNLEKSANKCSLGEKGPLAEKGQQMNKNIDIFYKELKWVIEMYENRRKNYIIHLKHLISLNIGKAYLVQ